MAAGEQMVYNGRAVLMLGPNEEDWWIGKASWEIKPTGFDRRGGGGNFSNTWMTGYQYFKITVDVATLTRVDIKYLLNMPLAANSHQLRYQTEQVPAAPGPYVITLDENAIDIDWITVFGHADTNQDAWSLMDAVTGAPADVTEYLPTVANITVNAGMAEEWVRIRYVVDSTNGEQCTMPDNYLADDLPLVLYTSEYVEGQEQDPPHGELWEISAAALHPDSVLKGGGDAQGGEGDASTLVFNVQSTGVVTYSRY